MVCSEEETKVKETAHLEQVFMANGYPKNYIRRALKPRRRGPPSANQRTDSEPTNDQPTNDQPEPTAERPRTTYISIPYVKGTSEKIGRILAPHRIRVGHSSRPTLRDKLVKVKDTVSSDLQKGVVYKTACDCGAT